MKVRKVVVYGDPVLRRRADPIDVFDDDLRDFIGEMANSLKYHQGAGLAAPQVGESRRLFLADDGGGIKIFINPEILASEGSVTSEEGCLSLPGIYLDVPRASQVRVRYLDPSGRELEETADGLLARIIQHENDHLDGVMICDRAGYLSRKLIAGRLRRLERETGVIL